VTFQYIKDRDSLRKRAEELVKELIPKAESTFNASFGFIPQIIVTRARMYYARVILESLPIIRVNEIFVDFYKADPILADRLLTYVLAHEIGHIIQRLKYGVIRMFSYPRVFREVEADRIAETLTGITSQEFIGLAYRLHKMTGTHTMILE
jgi:hypothetical protein